MPALSADRFDEFVALAFRDPPTPERRAEALRRLADPVFASRRRYVCGGTGLMVAATWILRDGRGGVLVPPRSRGPIGWLEATVIDEAVDAARGSGFATLDLRMPVVRTTEAVVASCRRTGALRGPGRVEFEALLDDLPKPDPVDASRLVVASASNEAIAADVLRRCATGSPDGLGEGESAEDALRVMLTRPHRTQGLPEVVHLGRRPQDATFTAFVCAQVSPEDRWSTLTMIALDPRVRGQGLAPVLQRHGFAMLRAQGGRLYRGGTTLTNAPMRSCFARNGVPEVARYDEFRWCFA